MFRISGAIIKNSKFIQEHIVCIEDYTMTRTQKVYQALDEICYELDLAKPVWLKSNQTDFIQHAGTRFTQDNFIEHIEFDYLYFHVIEEDY